MRSAMQMEARQRGEQARQDATATFLVARDNKLTGERGVLGYMRVSDAWMQEHSHIDVSTRSAYFPLSVGARAAHFTFERHSDDWPTTFEVMR